MVVFFGLFLTIFFSLRENDEEVSIGEVDNRVSFLNVFSVYVHAVLCTETEI